MGHFPIVKKTIKDHIKLDITIVWTFGPSIWFMGVHVLKCVYISMSSHSNNLFIYF